MMFLRRPFAMVVFVLIFVTLPAIARSAFVTELSETQIQTALQLHFPMSEYATFARVTLREPKVSLLQNSHDLIVMIAVDANIIGDTLRQGYMNIAVGLSYKSVSGGLYLLNPRLRQFEMLGVSPALVMELKAVVEKMAINSLPLVQIYKVKEKDLNHSLAKSQLKSYNIEQDRLILEFGFN